MQARVAILEEIRDGERPGEWCLCFQRVRYVYGNAEVEDGFRFIWRREDGSLQAARGQARIPHLSDALRLIYQAVEQGWEQIPSLNPNSQLPLAPEQPAREISALDTVDEIISANKEI